MSLTVVLAVAILSAAPPSTANTFFSDGPPPSKAIRVKQARGWLEGFGKLDTQVPTLSPRERQWLEREYDDQVASGTYTPRALAAMDSPEYEKRVVRQRLDRILSELRGLAAADTMPLEVEVWTWTELAADFMDVTMWQSVTAMVKRKDVAPDINGVKQLYLENHILWAQTILRRVVSPYFAGSLKRAN
jgi:hypothetical protein